MNETRELPISIDRLQKQMKWLDEEQKNQDEMLAIKQNAVEYATHRLSRKNNALRIEEYNFASSQFAPTASVADNAKLTETQRPGDSRGMSARYVLWFAVVNPFLSLGGRIRAKGLQKSVLKRADMEKARRELQDAEAEFMEARESHANQLQQLLEQRASLESAIRFTANADRYHTKTTIEKGAGLAAEHEIAQTSIIGAARQLRKNRSTGKLKRVKSNTVRHVFCARSMIH